MPKIPFKKRHYFVILQYLRRSSKALGAIFLILHCLTPANAGTCPQQTDALFKWTNDNAYISLTERYFGGLVGISGYQFWSNSKFYVAQATFNKLVSTSAAYCVLDSGAGFAPSDSLAQQWTGTADCYPPYPSSPLYGKARWDIFVFQNVIGCPLAGYSLDAPHGKCYLIESDTDYCPEKESNKGNPDYCPIADPIDHGTGNVIYAVTDYSSISTDLSFSRYYNSNLKERGDMAMTGGIFGWRHNFESRLEIIDNEDGTKTIFAIRSDGKNLKFHKIGGAWTSDAAPSLSLREITLEGGAGWKIQTPENKVEVYSATGRLAVIADKDGKSNSLYYTNGFLSEVRTSFAHSLKFERNDTDFFFRVLLPDDSYIDIDNATRRGVTYQDGSGFLYEYLPNHNLLSVRDRDGFLITSYAYDEYDRAISNELPGSLDRHVVGYQSAGTRVVTDALGANRVYSFLSINGKIKLASVSQPGGSGCSAASNALTYDLRGNVASRTDFKETGASGSGPRSCYAYDMSRNLESVRVEGLADNTSFQCPTDANAQATLAAYSIPVPTNAESVTAIKTSTQWHPDWRLESRRAGPKLITTSVYNGQPDPTAGNIILTCAPTTALVIDKLIAVLCRKIEQATADEAGTLGFGATPVGSPRVWNYTYNQYGQILTEDGPRTDVSDVTTYTYYTDTVFDTAGKGHTLGDLWKVTNAVGQGTEKTAYDKNGRVLEVKDANGVLTQSTYWPRGWLKSQSIITPGSAIAQTTLYNYGSVGQLKKVTQPDGSFTSYDYDAAHRLTDIHDSLNNSIHYTLDAAGNRTGEEVQDPAGALKRTTTRIYDVLGRLQNVVVQ